ncbi:MAG: DUF2064 domain-containing protein [Desulfobulbaceae bacterium]|nr:DUF2064 domain-containing protein [Desulfobulbaceae bacterium]
MNPLHPHPDQLIVFARYPQAGLVKTRMIPALGEEGAAELHRQLVERLMQQLQPVIAQQKLQLNLHYTGGSKEQMKQWLGSDIIFFPQQGNDLGERMIHALKSAQKQGTAHTIMVGSDCPAVDADIITQAHEQLLHHDLVLGPAVDGGYYLIGINSRIQASKQKQLFTTIAWGTADVFSQTLEKAQNAGLACFILPTLHDIDRPEDLEYFNYHARAQ